MKHGLLERALPWGGLLVSASALAYACGGTQANPRLQSSPKQVSGIAADDQSRCDFKGRADREVSETVGPGAIQPNIRRVYATLGTGEDRRRILLCREVDTNLDGVKDVVRTYTDRGDALNEMADTNYDGRIDTWLTFARGRIAKVEVDKSGDGKPDETRYYIQGALSRVQRDTNRDGKPDVWEIYDEGTLQRMGVDLDHDGRVDRWDRDEDVVRRELEQERKEAEEEEKQRAAETAAAADAGAADAAVTDARISVRKR